MDTLHKDTNDIHVIMGSQSNLYKVFFLFSFFKPQKVIETKSVCTVYIHHLIFTLGKYLTKKEK